MSKYSKLRITPIQFCQDSANPFIRLPGTPVMRWLTNKSFFIPLLCDPVRALSESNSAILSAIGRYLTTQGSIKHKRMLANAGFPRISVILAARDMDATIAAAMTSIIQQSYSNWELIVIDDASSDETGNIAQQYAKDDSRIKVLHNKKQKGAAWSRNLGISEATGHYITFQDADDQSEPKRLEYQLCALLGNNKRIVSLCNYVRVDHSGNVIKINGRPFSKAIISMMFYRKTVVDRIGYFLNFPRSEDSEYLERLKAVFGQQAEKHVFKILYRALVSPSSLTFSEGTAAKVDTNHIIHTPSIETNQRLTALRADHQLIREGEKDAFVPFMDCQKCPK
jgi:hypothetical protein